MRLVEAGAPAADGRSDDSAFEKVGLFQNRKAVQFLNSGQNENPSVYYSALLLSRHQTENYEISLISDA